MKTQDDERQTSRLEQFRQVATPGQLVPTLAPPARGISTGK